MKKKYLNKTNIILLLFIFTITFILSCEKEIGVIKPTSIERIVHGTLVDAEDNSMGIANAIVTITPADPSIDFPTVRDTTNENGYFEIVTKVLPASQPYKLQIDATNSGYQILDTVVTCSCDVLSLDSIRVRALYCVILINPQIATFGSKKIPRKKTAEQQFILKNPTENEIIIDSLGLSNTNEFKILANEMVFPFNMTSNQEVVINVSFTPAEIKEYFDTLKVYTNCFNGINFSLLQPVSELDSCGITISTVELSKNAIFADSTTSGTFTISNKYDNAIEIDTIILPSSLYTLENTNFPVTLVNKGDEQTFSFTFKSHDENSYNGNLEVITNCSIQRSTLQQIPQIIVAGRLYSFSDFGARIDSTSINRNLSVGRLEHNITVTNESPYFDLTISIPNGLNSPFSVEPSSSSITIDALSSQIYTVAFDLSATTERDEPYLGTLRLSTNGKSIDQSNSLNYLDINLIGDSRVPKPITDTLFIWNRKVSSDGNSSLFDENHLHEGINFSLEQIVGDSTLLCGQNQFTPPKFPDLQTADFRFNGMTGNDILNPSVDGNISIHNSWYHIQPLDPTKPFNFNNFNYQFNSSTSIPEDQNCLVNISANDVLVIKNKIGDRYYIVKIEKIDRENIRPNVEVEFLVISYFKHIPKSTFGND